MHWLHFMAAISDSANPFISKYFIYTLLITDGITLTMCIKMCKGFNNPGTRKRWRYIPWSFLWLMKISRYMKEAF